MSTPSRKVHIGDWTVLVYLISVDQASNVSKVCIRTEVFDTQEQAQEFVDATNAAGEVYADVPVQVTSIESEVLTNPQQPDQE